MGRGSSGLSGGGTTNSAGGGGAFTPASSDGNEEKIELTAITRDGERQKITVSIQDTSELDHIKDLDYTRGQGRFREANAYRALAADANRNAMNDKRENFMNEPAAKEGTFTKTDSVPVIVSSNTNNVRFIDKASGYVTKIDGDNVYIQKTNSGWALNIAGMRAGDYSSLEKAKANAKTVIMDVKSRSRSAYDSAKGQFRFLNKNLGKVSERIVRTIDYRDMVALGQMD